MYLEHYIQWQDHILHRDGQPLFTLAAMPLADIPLAVYEQAKISYPKFFKMDLLSRVAFLATELLQPDITGLDKNRIALALSSASGCIDVDKKYEESRQTVASPALFVYTLPNIMLGEICIRNGFKGEQMTTITAAPDIDWMLFYVTDVMTNRQTDACLLGHVEATEQQIKITLAWISKKQNDRSSNPFDRQTLERLFQ